MKKKILKAIILLLPLALVLVNTGGPALAAGPPGFSPPGNVIYNIYATDGYWPMADGTRLYSYGYIGGRSTDPVMYIDSATGALMKIVPGATAGTFAAVLNTAVGTAVTWSQLAPTGGLAAGAELLLMGQAQFPGPLIWAHVGDVVQINFKNLGVLNKKAPNDPHTIHLHAIDVDAANDGVPETSVASVPANAALPGAGNVIVYMFSTDKPGTYMYHCHQEADIHVTMGMQGAMVIYEAGAAGVNNEPGKPGTLWGWNYSREYIMLLSDTDTRIHTSEAQGAGAGNAFNMVNYQPQYWFVNMLSFPQTIHAPVVLPGVPAWADWKAAHPGMDPFIQGYFGEKVLLRVINLGFETQPMHMHGFHAKVLGGDQRKWDWSWGSNGVPNAATGVGLEKNTFTIGSGETLELLYDFSQQNPTSTYTSNGTTGVGTQTRYENAAGPNLNKPVVNTNTGKPAIPDPFAPLFAYQGGPTIGATNQGGGLPVILADTSQYFPFHNHDDYKATNNGIYPGGQFTMIVVRALGTAFIP